MEILDKILAEKIENYDEYIHNQIKDQILKGDFN